MHEQGRTCYRQSDFDKFQYCYLENDENEVHWHDPISFPVNRKREIDDRNSAHFLGGGFGLGA